MDMLKVGVLACAGVLMAVGGVALTTGAFAGEVGDGLSDAAMIRACGGDTSGVPSNIGVSNCRFVVTGRHGAQAARSAVKGQPYVSGCNGVGGQISGSFSYAEANTYTFGGAASFSIAPGVEISGGGDYSKTAEQGVSTSGAFNFDAGKKAQITVEQMKEPVDGAWEADLLEGDASGGVLNGHRRVDGQNALLPLAGQKLGIGVEIVDCSQNFTIAEGDIQFVH
jgi:hypothetical protein